MSKSDVKSSVPEWYRDSYNRVQAEEYLKMKEIGVFVVRRSESYQDSFVLSVKVPRFVNLSLVSHYLVVKNAQTGTYCVRGFETKQFADLTALVTHCSLMRDVLPVILNLDYYNPDAPSKIEFNKQDNDFIYYFTPTSVSTTSTSSLASTASSVQSDLNSSTDELFHSLE